MDGEGTKAVSINKGRPGMDQWSILVLGSLRVGLNTDYDRILELANQHNTLRERGVAIFAKAFLGIPAQQAAKITRPLRDRSRVVPRSDSACVFTKRSVVKMQALRNRVESLESM